MKNLHPRTKLTSLLAATCFAIMPPPSPSIRHRTEAIPTKTLLRERMRSSVSQAAFRTRQWVLNALYSNTDGNLNTANGYQALYSNMSNLNTAIGYQALTLNTSGSANTASGANALTFNTTGGDNTAVGLDALYQNTTGSSNTACGALALSKNTTGVVNTANGNSALSLNTTGISNTASGFYALASNTTGSYNIALGDLAGINLTTGKNNIDIGNKGVAGESNTIRLGKKGTQTATFIAGVSGTTVAGGVGVLIDSNGRLGTVVSSARFKDEVKPMAKASEAILALQPVTFRYKKDLDPAGLHSSAWWPSRWRR